MGASKRSLRNAGRRLRIGLAPAGTANPFRYNDNLLWDAVSGPPFPAILMSQGPADCANLRPA
jgi:hypothetical protein